MRAFALVLVSTAAFAQPATPPKFTVADVHPSSHNSIPGVRGPFFGDGRYELRYATMVDLIRMAYGVDPERIYGGPSWLEYDRYDIMAIAPKGSTVEARKLMLQSLLADRFHLTLHNDSKPMTAYKLTAGKNSKLQASSGSDTGCTFRVDQPPPPPPPAPGEPRPPLDLPVLVYTCKGTTMAAFAGALPSMPGADQYFDKKGVVDQTELSGNFDFTLRYTPKIPSGLVTKGEPMPLFEALEKQLGLKLELTNAPMPVIMVDPSAKRVWMEATLVPRPTWMGFTPPKPAAGLSEVPFERLWLN